MKLNKKQDGCCDVLMRFHYQCTSSKVLQKYVQERKDFFRQLMQSQAQIDTCSLFVLYAYHSMTAFQCIIHIYICLSLCRHVSERSCFRVSVQSANQRLCK